MKQVCFGIPDFLDFPIPQLNPKVQRIPRKSKEGDLDRKAPFYTEWLSDLRPSPGQTGRLMSSGHDPKTS